MRRVGSVRGVRDLPTQRGFPVLKWLGDGIPAQECGSRSGVINEGLVALAFDCREHLVRVTGYSLSQARADGQRRDSVKAFRVALCAGSALTL